MRRKGLIRLSGNPSRAAAATSGEMAELMELMTSPRLTALVPTRAVMEYQLMSASVAPWSFTAIQVPLPEQRPVGGEKRVARVVNARCFGSRAVQFDDLEIPSSAKISFACVTDVVASDEKAGELL